MGEGRNYVVYNLVHHGASLIEIEAALRQFSIPFTRIFQSAGVANRLTEVFNKHWRGRLEVDEPVIGCPIPRLFE